MFKALVFDMDGLMVDTERLYVATMRQIARRFGCEVSDGVLAQMMGRSRLESIEVFCQELGIPQSPAAVLALRESIIEEKFETDLLPMPGLGEVLDSAGRRLQLAVATASPRNFVDIILRHLDLSDRFHTIVCGDDITVGKPDPQIFQMTAGRLGLNPGECAVFEDSGNGVAAARAAGCYAVAVPNDHTRGHDFSPAHFIANDLAQAWKHIEQRISL